jgi:vacuolar-type H+-ATPase subunit E/Vma4
LKCEEKLLSFGVIDKDPNDPNRICLSVHGIIEVITDEDTKKLKKATKAAKEEAKVAKTEGMKETMKRFIVEQDEDLRAAYYRWIEGMIDAANCRFTKAVVQVFEQTVTGYTTDKATRLRIIDIATASSYRDANWAIEKLSTTRGRTNFVSTVPQKVCTGTAENVTF